MIREIKSEKNLFSRTKRFRAMRADKTLPCAHLDMLTPDTPGETEVCGPRDINIGRCLV